MMAKGQFAQFTKFCFTLSVLGGIFVGFPACATAKVSPSGKVIKEIKPKPLDVRAEISAKEIQVDLSSKEVAAGTLMLVSVRVPRELKNKPILGQFEAVEFPFFSSANVGDGLYDAILGIPYERKPGDAEVFIRIGEGADGVEVRIPFQVIDGNYPSESLHVDGKRVNPTSKKILQRIIREQAEVAQIYKRVTPQKYWLGKFELPIQSPITSPFGSRRVYNGQLKNFHPGLDLKAPMKTPIHSPAPGVVVLAKELFYTGNTVMIDHGYGVITLYAHMSRLKVKVGQEVTSHQILGLSGKTGRVNGPHLHWQAVVHRVKVNPLGLTQVVR